MVDSLKSEIKKNSGKHRKWWWLFGFSFFFELPYIRIFSVSISPHHITSLIAIIYGLFLVMIKKTFSNKGRCFCVYYHKLFLFFVILLSFSFLWSITGALHSFSLGAHVPISAYVGSLRIFLLILAMLSIFGITKGLDWLDIEESILRGFVYGAVVTSFWICINQTIYYLSGFHLNSFIFVDVLNSELPHTILNIYNPFSYYDSPFFGKGLLRSSGFAYDPGSTGPKLVMAFFISVFYLKDFFQNKKRFILMILIVISIFLTLNRTSILAFFLGGMVWVIFYIFPSFFQAPFVDKLSFDKEQGKMLVAITFIILLILLCIFIVNSDYLIESFNFVKIVFTGSTESASKHFGYIKNISNVLFGDTKSSFFGYGIRNSGLGIEKYAIDNIPGIYNYKNRFAGRWCPESTLIIWSLMGGIPSFFGLFLIYIATFFYALYKVIKEKYWKIQNRANLVMWIVLILLMFGYSMASTWLYVLIFILLQKIWIPAKRKYA